MLIIGLIIGGLVLDLGGGPNKDRLGFRYWIKPGAFNAYILTGSAGNFLAFWKSMVPAAFSYGNIQIVAISGSETRDPRRLIPSATKKVFYRILIFYICSIIIVGLIVYVYSPNASSKAFMLTACVRVVPMMTHHYRYRPAPHPNLLLQSPSNVLGFP